MRKRVRILSKSIKITTALAGARLDKFISDWLELSRTETWRLLEQKQIKLNNKKINKSFKGYALQAGDVLTVSEFRTLKDLNIFANDRLELDVIEDKPDYIVINKQAGMNIIPKTEEENNTVLNALVARYPEIQGVGEAGLHSGIVHRLDYNTSGVLIIAKRQERWRDLRSAFRNHKSNKIYHAIVEGHLMDGSAKMNLFVAQHKPARVKAVGEPNGQSRLCDLSWTTLEKLKKHSLLEIRLGTGFLHQIRVMLAELGHPVLADQLYGSKSSIVERQMLHAKSIKIDGISAIAEYSADFKEAIAQLA